MMTTYERGQLEGQRQTLLRLLERKFGPLSPVIKERLEAFSPEQLQQIEQDLFKAQSLKELNLEALAAGSHP